MASMVVTYSCKQAICNIERMREGGNSDGKP